MRVTLAGCLLALWAGCLGAQEPPTVLPEEERSAATPEQGQKAEAVDRTVGGIPVTAAGFVAPGTRVRVQSSEFPGQRYEGRIVEIDGESLLLGFPNSQGSLRFRRSLITKLEVSLGRHTRKKAGGRFGAVLLGVLGAAAGPVLIGRPNFFCEGSGCRSSDMGPGALVGAVVGIFAGSAIGGSIGGAIATESWQPVASSRISAVVRPRCGGGLAASLSVRF